MWIFSFFSRLLEVSWTAGIGILVVLLVRLPIFRFPRRLCCILWMIVLIRLLCPFSIPSPLPALTQQNGLSYFWNLEQRNIETLPDISLSQPIASLSGSETAAVTAEVPRISPAALLETIPQSTLITIWLTGVSLMLIYHIFCSIRFHRSLIGSVKLSKRLFLVDHLPSSFVAGIFRPKIYLPSWLPREEWEPVLLHEQAHIRWRDPLTKGLFVIALTIHWFHPLVWIGFGAFVCDMEMACDEAAVRTQQETDSSTRACYCALLLRLSGKGRFPTTPLSFGSSAVRQRIAHLYQARKASLPVIFAALGILAALAVMLLTSPISQQELWWGCGYRVAEAYDAPSLPDQPPFSRFLFTADHRLAALMSDETSDWKELGVFSPKDYSRQQLYRFFDATPNRIQETLDNAKQIHRADDGEENFYLLFKDRRNTILAGGITGADTEKIQWMAVIEPDAQGMTTGDFDCVISHALQESQVTVFSLFETREAPGYLLAGWQTSKQLGYSVFRYRKSNGQAYDFQLLRSQTFDVPLTSPAFILTNCSLGEGGREITVDLILSADSALASIQMEQGDTVSRYEVTSNPSMATFPRSIHQETLWSLLDDSGKVLQQYLLPSQGEAVYRYYRF